MRSKEILARTSRQQAMRLRTCLAAFLPLAGCANNGQEEANTPPVVVVPAHDDFPATTSGGEVVAPTAIVDEPPPEKPDPVKSVSRPGWKNADGLYCQAEVDSQPTDQGCGHNTQTLFAIPDQPGGMHGFSFDEDGTKRERATVKDACCYGVIRPRRGRPLRQLDGSTAAAPLCEQRDWAAFFALGDLGLDPEARARAAAVWAEDAALEHASVAEFSRISLALMGLGAPARLIALAQRAALDEIRHAETAYGIASALAGRSLGPGRLDLSATDVTPSLIALVQDTLEDGCIGEALAALELAVAATTVTDPALAEAMTAMADDERRHAELGYAILRWALEVASEGERAAIARAIELAIADLKRSIEASTRESDDPPTLGRLGRDEQCRVRSDGIALAILPALHALQDLARAA
jgi:hypothetical protein